MATGHLDINLDAIARNWRALDQLSAPSVQTGAVVKADCYGLGAARIATALAAAGVRQFFVALAEEGAAMRQILGPDKRISVLGGHMEGDTDLIAQHALVPMLGAPDQIARHLTALPGHPFGVALNTGMNRLGLQPGEWQDARQRLLTARPTLLMSHLACADDPAHPMNARQLAAFRALTEGTSVPRSLAASAGIALGSEYHFDLTRPGIGLYGVECTAPGLAPALHLSLPVVRTRTLALGETVGYGNAWAAPTPCRIATLAGGYADGIFRALGNRATLWAGAVPCPLVGRVSMDFITVDVSHLAAVPERLDLISAHQSAEQLGRDAGTSGYEVLTALGPRFQRRYLTDEAPE